MDGTFYKQNYTKRRKTRQAYINSLVGILGGIIKYFTMLAATYTDQRLGNSGLKISKLILGWTTSESSKWEGSPWVLDEEESLKVIKASYNNGINTWVSSYEGEELIVDCSVHLGAGHGGHVLER